MQWGRGGEALFAAKTLWVPTWWQSSQGPVPPPRDCPRILCRVRKDTAMEVHISTLVEE